jgi:hypothetical protein
MNGRFAPKAAVAERSDFTRQYRVPGHQESTARTNGGTNSAWAELIGYSSSTKVPMLITLVAVLCNSQLCLEKVVTTSEQ